MPAATLHLLIVVLVCAPLHASPDDSKPLRLLEAAYVEAWQINDPAAVMATISHDAVIIPSRMKPIREAEKIRAFWFLYDGSTTTVTSYRTTIEGASVEGDTGWIFGTGDLSFTWGKHGNRTDVRQTSAFTMIARREPDGQWRIVHRMWTDTSP